jgi:hypothetical protein
MELLVVRILCQEPPYRLPSCGATLVLVSANPRYLLRTYRVRAAQFFCATEPHVHELHEA